MDAVNPIARPVAVPNHAAGHWRHTAGAGSLAPVGTGARLPEIVVGRHGVGVLVSGSVGAVRGERFLGCLAAQLGWQVPPDESLADPPAERYGGV